VACVATTPPLQGPHLRVPRRDESDVVSWTYEGLTGPEYWSSIIPGAYLCKTGMHARTHTSQAIIVPYRQTDSRPPRSLHCIAWRPGTLQSPINIETKKVMKQYSSSLRARSRIRESV
jgi:carbonic anhydrase